MTLLRRNAAASLAGRVVTAVVWIAATPFVLSRLGPERFGVWSLFYAFNGYLTTLDLGVGNTMIRYLATQRASHDRRALWKTLRRGLCGAVGLGLLWAAVVLLLRGWIVQMFHVPPPLVREALDALVIFGLCVLLLFPMQALLASLQGFERIDLTYACMVLGVVAHVSVLCVAVSAGAGLRGVALAGLIGQAVTLLSAAALLWRELRKVPEGSGAGGPSWRELLQFSAALQLLAILVVFQYQSGRFVLGLIGNLTMVSEYELAFRVAFTIGLLPIIVRDPIIPTVARTMESEGPRAVASLYGSTSRWVYTNSVLALGLLWLLAPDIVRVWLGPGHETIPGLIRLWVIAYALNLAYAPGVAIARGIGKPRYEILSYGASLATHLALCVLWIPGDGTRGAVNAAVASFGVGLLVFAAVFHAPSTIAPLGRWLARELLPRAAAGTAAVVLSAGLLSLGPWSSHLPPPGLARAAVTTVLFGALFGLLFYPLGDTQRFCQAVWAVSGGALIRRGVRPS